MNIRKSIAAVVGAAILVPAAASASFVLDTGTPAGSSTYVLSTSQYFAGEFAVNGGDTITDLSAYLTQGAGSVGDTFTFAIYGSSGFTSRANQRPAPLYTATGTYSADGWNTTNVNWTPTTTGDYWLALQVSSTSQTHGLNAPGEVSASTGTAPALAFAYANGASGQYTTSGAPAIGLEVSDTPAPVPLPGAVWLLGSGMLGLRAMARRRRTA
ncbi:MAG: hypothetical protein P4L83_12100 [Nevskia sp.]|nr:hypothetical protein [Nevskia sp.]